jgi:hypothetical protein
MNEAEYFDWYGYAIDLIRRHRLQVLFVWANASYWMIHLPPKTQKEAELPSPWLRLATVEEANQFQLAVYLDKLDRDEGRDLVELSRIEMERLTKGAK